MPKVFCPVCSEEAVVEVVECEKCEEWFHFSCVGVDKSIEDREWICDGCKEPPPKPESKENLKSASVKPTSVSSDDDFQDPLLGSAGAGLLAQMEAVTKDNEELQNENQLMKLNQLALEEKIKNLEATSSASSRSGESKAPQSTESSSEKPQGDATSSDVKKTSISPADNELQKRLLNVMQKSMELLERRRQENSSVESPSLRNESFTAPTSTEPSQSLPTKPEVENNGLETLATSMRRVYLRKLPKFDGKEKEWPAFISIYESTTKDGGFSESDNVARLKEALAGEAQRHVLSLLNFSTTATPIIDALREAFGRPDRLVLRLTETLLEFPEMKSETDTTLRNLAMATMDFVACLHVLKQPGDLKNEFVLQKLLDKLHYSHYKEWIKERLKRDDPTSANLEDFGKFLMARVKEIPPAKFVAYDQRNEKKSSNGRVNSHAKSDEAGSVNKCPKCHKSHPLFWCKDFKQMTLEARCKLVKDLKICQCCLNSNIHVAANCPREFTCNIDGCGQKHNRFLHVSATTSSFQNIQRGQRGRRGSNNQSWRNANNPPTNSNLNANAQTFSGGNNNIVDPNTSLVGATSSSHQVLTQTAPSDVYYKIIPVRLSNITGDFAIETFAFLDDGSSLTLLDSDVYEQLHLSGSPEQLSIKWTGGIKRQESSNRTSLIISGLNSKKSFHMINVHTASSLELPMQSIDAVSLQERYKHLRNIPFNSYNQAQPKILIGLKHASLLNGDNRKSGELGDPIAFKTPLGWLVYGATAPSLRYISDAIHSNQGFQLTMQEAVSGDDELHKIVKDHFTTEGFGVVPLKEDLVGVKTKRAIEIMQKTLVKVGDQYEIGLLWSADDIKLPDSYPMALKRLESEEKSLQRRGLLDWKNEHIKGLLKKGYARIATKEDLQRPWKRVWYCPTFVVVNPNKIPPKPRDVADVAAKVNGISLNSCLLPGPNNLAPLVRGLVRIREHEYAVNADVKEMFPRIRIREPDQQCQRFLWRDGDSSKPPTIYIMQAMMFGPTCSPSKAQFVKNTHAAKYEKEFPEAAGALRDYTYVDDYMNSHATLEDGVRISQDAIRICKTMNFELVGFQSNSLELLDQLPQSNVKNALVSMDCRDTENFITKILGMYWNTQADYFTFKLNSDELLDRLMKTRCPPTKREVLKIVMRIFDPLGLIAHYTIRGRILLQEVWREGTGWDETIPKHLQEQWIEFVTQLPNLEKLEIPRQYSPLNPDECQVQLIVFVDASEQAYAATAYARFVQGDVVHVAHIMGKSRVAPIKKLTIPQLELQAAVLGCRLAVSIKQLHSIKFVKTFFLSDSRTVLSWVASTEFKFKTFVAVRIGEILDGSSRREWYFIRSNDNIADDATKWKDPTMGNSKTRWSNGSTFLQLPESEWPIIPAVELKDDDKILKTSHIFLHSPLLPAEERFTVFEDIAPHFQASWPRFVRVIAFILRFTNAIQRKEISSTKFITPEEFEKAQLVAFQKIQQDAFPDVVKDFNQKAGSSCHVIKKSCSFRKLNPIMKEDRVIRASSRAQLAKTSYASRNPVILPKHHPLVDVLIRHHHEKNLHLGEDTTIGDIREVVWIIDIKSAVRRVIKNCQWCKNRRATPQMPMMGQLPEARLDFGSKPFTHVGVDAFGPYAVKFGRGANKRYGMIFTCLSFRAVHVELLRDMSTAQVLMAMRRFFSARGRSLIFYSDNGKNFVGAANVLHKDLASMQTEIGELAANIHQLKWKFIPAHSPWFGGAWERLIQSIKKCVDFLLKGEIPFDDVLETALKDATFLMNRRPLSHVPVDLEDSKPLTPNTALFGDDNDETALAPGFVAETDKHSTSRYRRAQHLTCKFMSRWLREYLPEINRREKWNERTKMIEIGDVVVVTEPNEPRDAWKKGRVIKLHPGPDQEVRAVDVKLADGTIRPSRSVGRLVVLDVNNKSSAVAEPTPSTGGGMSLRDLTS